MYFQATEVYVVCDFNIANYNYTQYMQLLIPITVSISIPLSGEG